MPSGYAFSPLPSAVAAAPGTAPLVQPAAVPRRRTLPSPSHLEVACLLWTGTDTSEMKSDLSVARSSRPYGSSRVAAIDAARGAAMLFVCLAHFTNVYHFMNGKDELGAYLVLIGMVASPTFVIVSGLVAAFLAITHRDSFPDLRRKLIDRGLFLLVVGHLVLSLSGAVGGQGFVQAYRVEYVTDAIGFAVLFGPWLVDALSARSRLLLGATIFALDWCAILFWTPSDGIQGIAKEYLVGIVAGGRWGDTAGGFAPIPWFAVYLFGTVIGQRVGAFYKDNNRRAAHQLLGKIGTAGIACSLAVHFLIVVAQRAVPVLMQTHPAVKHFLSIRQKFPPGPTYLCFFGGAGMLLMAVVLEADRRGVQRWLLNRLREVGQASFFAYLIQYYVYVVVFRALRLPYTQFWPLLFLVSLFPITLAARGWNAKVGNDYLSVGLWQLFERKSRRARQISDKQVAMEIPTT